METVCPQCLVFQPSRFCGECGSETRPGNSCSKCGTSAPIGTKFCGECGGSTFKNVVESRGRSGGGGYVAPRPQQQNTKVDTSSIYGTVTPSAVYKGVSGGADDALSKYRINNQEDLNQDIDWKKTLRAASRANTDDDNVTVVKGPEPVVNNPHTTQTYTRPATVPPSEQMRREDVWGNRGNTNAVNPGAYRPPQNTVVRTPSQPNQPPPGRTYNPPPTRSVGVTVEESTIRPSILRDGSDPLEKYRIKDTGADTVDKSQVGYQPKTVFHREDSDPLQRYRVKTPEEEEKTWNIYLFGLRADPDKPVQFLCDGNIVYAGDGINGLVNTRVVYQSQGPTTAITLSIKSMNFNLNKNLEIAKGRFVKFSIEQEQLKFRQQRTEIDN